MENWKSIEGYEGLYEVSDEGRVKSLRSSTRHPNGCILKAGTWTGYALVGLNKDRVAKKFYVHRLVAEAFHGLPDGKEVNHLNGQKLDNRASNLEVCDHQQNITHAWGAGLLPPPPKTRGVLNGRATVSEADVLNIWDRLKHGANPTELARELKISRNIIYDIKRRRKWVHILPEGPRL